MGNENDPILKTLSPHFSSNLPCKMVPSGFFALKIPFCLQNLSSMFAAAAAAASGGQRSAGRPSFPPPSLFGNNKRPSGLESPPASLDNRSTPGSLDLSRSKEDYLEDMDSNEMPPTMVKMEAMVYPKMDSEEDEEGVQTRLEKRVFQDEDLDDDDHEGVQDLSAKKPKLDNENEINPENETKPGDNNNEKLDDLRVKDEFKERKEEEQS